MKTVTASQRQLALGKYGVWGLCIVLLVASLGFFSYQSSRPVFEAYYQNPGNELLSQRLPDGSTLQLAPNSAIHLRFYERVRRADLHQGEVVFVIDPKPVPLRLEAGNVRVLAHEGELKLRQASDAVEVQVLAGTAQTQKGRWWPDRQQLGAGQQVRWFD